MKILREFKMPKLSREFKARFQVADEDEARVVSIMLDCKKSPRDFSVLPGSRFEFDDDCGIGLLSLGPRRSILKSNPHYLPRRPERDSPCYSDNGSWSDCKRPCALHYSQLADDPDHPTGLVFVRFDGDDFEIRDNGFIRCHENRNTSVAVAAEWLESLRREKKESFKEIQQAVGKNLEASFRERRRSCKEFGTNGASFTDDKETISNSLQNYADWADSNPVSRRPEFRKSLKRIDRMTPSNNGALWCNCVHWEKAKKILSVFPRETAFPRRVYSSLRQCEPGYYETNYGRNPPKWAGKVHCIHYLLHH